MSGRYDDSIGLPHHQSATRPHMPLRERAAQFSPFAALTGYGDAVRETARLTGERIELDDSEKAAISDRLQIIAERIKERPEVAVTYFLPDCKKAGGEYITVNGRVKKIDEYDRAVVLTDGRRLPIDEIAGIESPVFGDAAIL